MIKVNDVRVGNFFIEEGNGYVQWDWKDFANYVKDKRDGFELEHLGEIMVISDKIEPIPLTPEILEKARFNKVDNEKDEVYYWYSKKLSLTEFKKRFKLAHYDNPVYIKYLHQLQNLYFALTGEELEVNL